MNKLLIRSLFTFLLIVFSLTNSYAGQTAKKTCLDSQCEQYELRIIITSGNDEGLQGATGILSTTADPQRKIGYVAYWTTRGQWTPLLNGEIVQPTNSDLQPLPAKTEFVVFRGNNQEICNLAGGRSFDVFAWHIGLPPEQLIQYKDFLYKYEIRGWQADNFISSVEFAEANKQRKVGKVYSQHCPATN